MKKRNTIILILFLLMAVAAVFIAFTLFDKNVKHLSSSKADLITTATDLIKKFETDEVAANKEYLGGKLDFIITVSGTVKEIIKDETGTCTVVLGDSTTRSSVRCTMDSLQNTQASSLKTGSDVSIKGAITGFMKDDLGIGSDVVLNRCVIEIKK
jgi:ATP-dependent protease HslVU (ClpYQ) peptidase subunit